MKILVVDTGLAQDICRVLSKEGHEVLYFINWMKAHPSVEEQMYGKGLFEEWGIKRVDNYMKYIKDVDLILFADVSWGEDIDYLREKGMKVFGASKDGELLENDRLYAKEVLTSVGISVPEYYSFESIPEAISWLKDSKDIVEGQDKRYVIKFSTVRTDLLSTYVPVNYQDTLRYLSRAAGEGSDIEVMLEECIDGIEVACGAFFNGRKFVRPFNINFEHKKLMPGEIGPNTGEMGTAMFYTFNEDNVIVADFLKLEEVLKEMNYRGYFDLNYMLGMDGKLYGIEATSRFGFPTIMIQECLHKDKLGDIIDGVADGSIDSFDVLENHWAIGVGVNVAGYPYTIAMEKFGYNSPIYGIDEAIENGIDVRFAGVIKDDKGQYLSCPGEGRVLVIDGKGETLSEAIKEAYSGMHYIQMPDMMYRIDIGEKIFIYEDLLRRVGILTEEVRL